MDSKKVEETINTWVEKVIIGQKICPFAEKVWEENLHRVFIFEGDNRNLALDFSNEMIEKFKDDPGASYLMAFPEFRDNFIQFYNFSALVEEEIKARGLQEVIQVVTFHPKFRFEGEKVSSRGNYVNRSPYPILHFLWFEDVTKIIEKFGEEIGAEVSKNNNEKLNRLSEGEFTKNISQYIDGHWPIEGN